MLFRPHRGGLAEAMAEAVEVDGVAGLVDHLRAIHPPYGPPFDEPALRIRFYCDEDERIGWRNVYVVTMEPWGVLGFVADPQHALRNPVLARILRH